MWIYHHSSSLTIIRIISLKYFHSQFSLPSRGLPPAWEVPSLCWCWYLDTTMIAAAAAPYATVLVLVIELNHWQHDVIRHSPTTLVTVDGDHSSGLFIGMLSGIVDYCWLCTVIIFAWRFHHQLWLFMVGRPKSIRDCSTQSNSWLRTMMVLMYLV